MGRTKGPKLTKVDKKKGKREEGGKDGTTTLDGAEDKEYCIDCGKQVLESQQGIECDGCGFWHHCSCEAVNEETYEFMRSHDSIESVM